MTVSVAFYGDVKTKSIKRRIFYIIKFVLTFQNIIILLGSTSFGKCIFAFLFVVWCWDLTEGILEHMGGGWLLLFMILTLMPYQYWYWGPDKKEIFFTCYTLWHLCHINIDIVVLIKRNIFIYYTFWCWCHIINIDIEIPI